MWLFRWVCGEWWMMDGFVVLGLWLGVFVDCGYWFACRGSGFCSQWWGLWVAAFVVDGGLVLVYPLQFFLFFFFFFGC